jgi:hypothetical protein
MRRQGLILFMMIAALSVAVTAIAQSVSCSITTSQVNYTLVVPINSSLILYGPNQHAANCDHLNITLNEWGNIIIIARKASNMHIELPSNYYPYCYPNNASLIAGNYLEMGNWKEVVCTIQDYSSLDIYKLSLGIEIGALLMLISFLTIFLLQGTRRAS